MIDEGAPTNRTLTSEARNSREIACALTPRRQSGDPTNLNAVRCKLRGCAQKEYHTRGYLYNHAGRSAGRPTNLRLTASDVIPPGTLRAKTDIARCLMLASTGMASTKTYDAGKTTACPSKMVAESEIRHRPLCQTETKSSRTATPRINP